MLPGMTITSIAALRALYDPVRERSAKKEIPQLDAHARRFIGLSPMLVIASGDVANGLDASPRGGRRASRTWPMPTRC